jgi:hypothetical protein
MQRKNAAFFLPVSCLFLLFCGLPKIRTTEQEEQAGKKKEPELKRHYRNIQIHETKRKRSQSEKMRETIFSLHAWNVDNLFVRTANGSDRVLLAVVRTLGSVVHWPLLAETATVTLACVCRFQLGLLAGRNEVSVFLQVFDDLLGDYLSLESPQSTLDRFVVVYMYRSHYRITSFRLKCRAINN